jgi:hypothetical protein
MILFPALTGQLADDVRAAEAQLSICDGLVPQFALTGEMGGQFSDAWFAARQVIGSRRRREEKFKF